MLKRNACRLATALFGLPALLSCCGQDGACWPQSAGMVLTLLSAIFATQWIHYQKRLDEASGRSCWPAWLRKLLY